MLGTLDEPGAGAFWLAWLTGPRAVCGSWPVTRPQR